MCNVLFNLGEGKCPRGNALEGNVLDPSHRISHTMHYICYCYYYNVYGIFNNFFLIKHEDPSIHCSMGSSPVGVQCTLDYYFPRVSVLRMYVSLLHYSFTSFSHSLFFRPHFIFPFISPNTTSFTSLLYIHSIDVSK